MRVNQAKGTGPLHDSLGKLLLLATLVPILTALYSYGIPSVPSLYLFLVRNPQRDDGWAETVVHPVLLWHPFPRKVLIAGGGTGALVKEALRHITTTPIHWIDTSSPNLSTDDDILNRTVRHSNQSVDNLLASGGSAFDVIILDDPRSSDLIQRAASRLSGGGVLAFSLPDAWELALSHALAVFKHVHLFTPLDSSEKSLYYAIATNSDAYPPPQQLSVSYVDTLIGRRVEHKSSLKHYDGETHLRIFLLQRNIRVQLRSLYRKSSRPTSRLPDFAPFESTTGISNPLHPKVVTLTRDLVQCEKLPSSEQDAIDILVQSLKSGEATGLRGLTSYSWSTYQNTTTHWVPPGFDSAAIISGPELETSRPVDTSTPAHLVVTAIYDGGSVSLHILPHFKSARASVTNFNGWVAPEEILNSLADFLRAIRSSGSATTGPPPLIHSGGLEERLSHLGDGQIGSLGYWRLSYPYWTSPKVELRRSSVAGTGNWAKEDISEGEVVFRGPIEADLINQEEYKRFPIWRKLHADHFGEWVHEEIRAIPPSMVRIDVSYYLNHACSPNVRYDDSYDVMIALRNITAGEEVTFDYTTSNANTSFKCQCGSSACRHTLSPADWANEALVARLGKEAFWPFFKSKILRKMEKEKGKH